MLEKVSIITFKLNFIPRQKLQRNKEEILGDKDLGLYFYGITFIKIFFIIFPVYYI
jgi:hypothetical protein